jgi:hypothetical protein
LLIAQNVKELFEMRAYNSTSKLREKTAVVIISLLLLLTGIIQSSDASENKDIFHTTKKENIVMTGVSRTFHISEGLSENYFVQGKTSAHVMLTGGRMARIIVSFPGGNSGAAVFFDGRKPGMDGFLLYYKDRIECFIEGEKSGVSFVVESNVRELSVSDVCLDSIRAVRDLRYPENAEVRARNNNDFVKSANLPKMGYLVPSMTINEKFPPTLSWHKKSLDGKNNYYLDILPINGTEFSHAGRTLTFTSQEGNVTFEVRASVDYLRLTPYDDYEILNDKTSKYRGKLAKHDPVKSKRFEEALKALGFLSYREKFLAGSWRFLTYFGRDTMMSLMLLYDSVKREFYEAGMQSIIDRMAPDGAVAHEEDIGGQAVAVNIAEYLKLKGLGMDREADVVKENLNLPVYDYKMVDDNFMFPIMLGKYFNDENVSREQKRNFMEKKSQEGGKNIEVTLRNFQFVLKASEPFKKSGNPVDLIRIHDHENVGDWRDSDAGLGWGKYPGGINVELVANALTEIQRVIESGIYSKHELQAIANGKEFDLVSKVLDSSAFLDEFISKWRDAKDFFRVKLSADEVREKLRDYFENHSFSGGEKEVILGRVIDDSTTVRDFVYNNKTPDILKDGIEFFALSLDGECRPVEVMNSDAGFILFTGDPSSEEIENILKIINLPFPIGLTEETGLLTANPVFATDRSLWTTLNRDAYHGMVVWSWQMALAEKGLERQIYRFHKKSENKLLVRKLYDTLRNLNGMKDNVGELVNTELWTSAFVNGRMLPKAYGQDESNETESNPVQLWSTVGISTMRGFDEIKDLFRKK